MLFGHGDDGYRLNARIVADFSTNVWWGGEPAGLKEHLWEHWSLINRYPEVVAERLAAKIGLHHGLQPGHIIVTNGTTESIYLIAQAFRAESTCIAVPTFSEYEDACRLHRHSIRFIPWTDLHPGLPLTPGLFFICQPNNPTGAVFPGLVSLIDRNPDSVFVVDEAFIEFTDSAGSLIHHVKERPNLIILRSLTKAYAIPGLRLGYIAAPLSLVQTLTAYKMPWTVNALAIEAGHFIFDGFQKSQLPLRQLLQEKALFQERLQQAGIMCYPTHTHFFLARTGHGTAAELKDFLLRRHGLLIRDASNFRTLEADHFRVATLSPPFNHLLITALQQWNQLTS